MLETDQESALISYEAKAILQKLGTQMEARPKHGHAPIVERHHAILRETYLKIKQQADEEGVAYTMERLISMAVHQHWGLHAPRGRVRYTVSSATRHEPG